MYNQRGNPYPGTMSFLPEDTINPAIQNLGETAGDIYKSQIGQQEGLQKQFQSLIDASYGDIWANDQKEVSQDWDKLRSNAINVFKTASEKGMPVNQMEYAGIMKQHKDLIHKIETAQEQKKDYANAITQAAHLQEKGELDPQSLVDLENAKNNPKGIYDRTPFSSLIKTQYSDEQLYKQTDDALKTAKIAKSVNTKLPNGDIQVRNYYDPQNIREVLEAKAKFDPRFAKQVTAKFGSYDNFIKAQQDILDKNDQLIKPKPTGASPATITINQPTPLHGGGNSYKPLPQYQTIKVYNVAGQTKKGQLGEYNDKTGEVEFIPQKKVLKTSAAENISFYESKIADKATTQVDKDRYQKLMDAEKADEKNYTITPDYDNVEIHKIDDIVGARNAYTNQTNKGGQKLNIPKQTGKIYIGANGKEYPESAFEGMDIQKLIKDKKIKPK